MEKLREKVAEVLPILEGEKKKKKKNRRKVNRPPSRVLLLLCWRLAPPLKLRTSTGVAVAVARQHWRRPPTKCQTTRRTTYAIASAEIFKEVMRMQVQALGHQVFPQEAPTIQ